MTETPTGPEHQDETTGDPTGEGTVRQHPQDPAEGPDDATEERPDVPRVHPQDPAEG